MKLKIVLFVILVIGIAVFCNLWFTTTVVHQIVPVVPTAEHKHKAGQFGGIIVELGKDNYHLEASLNKDLFTIYTLDKDESRVINVEKQVIEAYVRSISVDRISEQFFEIMPSPQNGDGDKASRFVGRIPVKYLEYLAEDDLIIYFTIMINGERFRARIHLAQTIQTDLSNDEEKKLFLTPGGCYTGQDIIDNGRMTSSQKFKGFFPSHDLKPKKGDRICPITLTKANPKCSWIINGKEYWFCCPPCVEEFVKLAKEKPEQVKSPERYVKGE